MICNYIEARELITSTRFVLEERHSGWNLKKNPSTSSNTHTQNTLTHFNPYGFLQALLYFSEITWGVECYILIFKDHMETKYGNDYIRVTM